MKNIVALCAALAFSSTFLFASPSAKVVKDSKENKSPEGFVSCSVTVNGITYSTTSFAFSDEKAAEKCADRLANIVSSIQ